MLPRAGRGVRSFSWLARVVCSVVALHGLEAAPLTAQCQPQWTIDRNLEFGFGIRTSVAWPAPGSTTVVAVGGNFGSAGTTIASNVALYDPVTRQWSALSSGVDAPVAALAVLANGNLVAGGAFTHAGGVAAAGIAQWDGTAWSPLGAGFPGPVWAMAVAPNGDLFASCRIADFMTGRHDQIARWNGQAWTLLPAPTTLGSFSQQTAITALTVLPNGHLVAACNVGFIGGWYGISASIVEWNGTTWSAIKSPANGGGDTIDSFAVTTTGELWAAGEFVFRQSNPTNFDPGYYHGLMRWMGGTLWSQAGSGSGLTTAWSVRALPAGGVVYSRVDRIYGGAWWPDQYYSYISSTTAGDWATAATAWTFCPTPGGDVFAGGNFTSIAGIPAESAAVWNGTAWSAPAAGVGGGTLGGINSVSAAVALANGDEVVVGSFRRSSGSPMDSVAVRHPGEPWRALGTGYPAWGQGYLNAVTQADNGDILVGGGYSATSSGLAPLLRWDGSTWRNLGLSWAVRSLLTLRDGSVLVAGEPNGGSVAAVCKWNGQTFSNLPAPGVPPPISAIAEAPNGDIFVASAAPDWAGPNRLTRWNGTVWQPLPVLGGRIVAMAMLPSGDLIVRGEFSIARWDGSSWHGIGSLRSGTAGSLAVLHDGSILCGDPLVRWDGTSWQSINQEIRFGGGVLAVHPSGRVLVAGNMSLDNAVTAWTAVWTPPCPATSATFGSGCTYSGTPCVLESLASPWAGATYRARATGMPTSGLAIGLWGLTQQQVPLSLQFPQSGAGCDQVTTADIMTFTPASGGVAETELFVPRGTWLVGITGFHQVVGVDFAAPGGPLAVSTNGLRLTVGTY